MHNFETLDEVDTIMETRHEQFMDTLDDLERFSKDFLEKLDEIDGRMQLVPREIVSRYGLEEKYYEHVPIVIAKLVKLEMLSSYANNSSLRNDTLDYDPEDMPTNITPDVEERSHVPF